MLADRLEQWALAYIAEGELKGEMLVLKRLLSKRFATSLPKLPV